MAPDDQQAQGRGGEYLTLFAERVRDLGMPYSQEFLFMLSDMASVQTDTPVLGGELVAARPLWDEEKTPAGIVNAAAAYAAIDNGDLEALQQVLDLGLHLLAKWPSYLCTVGDGHPHLQYKVTGKDEAQSAESYLLGAAEGGVEGGPGGLEYGSAFASLVAGGGLEQPVQRGSAEWEDLVDLERVARRPLTLPEVHAMSGIMAAYTKAIGDGNIEAAEEIVRVGLILFARWQDYVMLMSPDASQPDAPGGV
jgi:hypothetical protein